MRQEVDIRYVVTSLKGSAQHLYENVYCQRGQMENLIKLHKAQLASDRMSCHSATANQVRLVLHTAAFWLMHGVRAAIPQASPLAKCEFATIRERLVKIGARVIEHVARIRVQLPTSCQFATIRERLIKIGARVIEHIARIRIPAADELPGGGIVPNRGARPAAIRPMSRGAACPDKPPPQADQPHTRCKASCFTPIQLDRSPLRGPPVKSVKTLGVMHDPG